jgi:hypothetical protein
MTIPETQLQTWSNSGATDSPRNTHLSIRNAIDTFKNWQSENVSYETYLSGSYGNSTNIHGNSDVDLVVELNSITYSNLTKEEKSTLRIEPADYSWDKFRQDVITALVKYYGTNYIDTTGKKAVKVLPVNGRQKADVIVSTSYTYYENLKVRENGIRFLTQPDRKEVINYPKAHLKNGEIKNGNDRTRGWFKRSIRTYKNARDKIYGNKPQLQGKFPSYFIECLLYNVVDSKFGGTYQSNFLDTLNWLNDEVYSDRAEKMVCQNGMYYLFWDSLVTWNINDARKFVSELIELWNNW